MNFTNCNQILNYSTQFNSNDKELIKNSGVVFTPLDICNHILDKINPQITESICEPSVGKGVFIFCLLERFLKVHSISDIVFFIENNLFCYDINPDFIYEIKLNIQKWCELNNYTKLVMLNNIHCDDFLLNTNYYDIIIGNPPYVRIQNLDEKYVSLIKTKLNSFDKGNSDLYYAFIEMSLIYSKRVGFIIPNSFLKTKSGLFLRQLIKPRVEYIKDFGKEKIWKDIGAYTLILILSDISNNFIYDDNKTSINIDKLNLKNSWNFYTNTTNFDIKLNHYSIGICTLADSIFIMDSYDDNYCFNNGFTIEKELCMPLVKATKMRNFDEHKFILYPYIGTVIMSEDFIKQKYPNGYKYLLSNKNRLELRDRGKLKTWYEWGRKQGLLKPFIGRRIIIPLAFSKKQGIYIIELPINTPTIVQSGIYVDIDEIYYTTFLEILYSKDFSDFCEKSNDFLRGKDGDIFITIKTSSIKEYLKLH